MIQKTRFIPTRGLDYLLNVGERWASEGKKSKELFSRGYAQNDIANTLHISQPTISRDLHYIKKLIRKNQERNVERYNEAHSTMLMGLEEAIKKFGTIIDSSKTDDRERVKAIISL